MSNRFEAGPPTGDSETHDNTIQPFPFKGGGFEQKKINENGERAPLTEERREKMNRMIDGVATLFEGSKIQWAIDGGLSVSLLKGDYLGEHRDLDIAVEDSELSELQGVVEEKGFGLFVTLNVEKREDWVMKRVDAQEFSQANTYLFWIIAVDEDGLIQKDKDLSFVNVHIVKRNEEGLPVRKNGTTLPSYWFESKHVLFQNKELPVAHPAKTTYYKLLSLRKYDIVDLLHLAGSGALTVKDLEEVDSVLGVEMKDSDPDKYQERRKVLDQLKTKIISV